MAAAALLLALLSPAETVAERFSPPEGAARVSLPRGHFGRWARKLEVAPRGAPVLLFDGTRKARQDVHAAVLGIDIGSRDLQQCADLAIRLHAEHRRATGRPLCFRFTSGHRARWTDWAGGLRPQVRGREVRWVKTAEARRGRAAFRSWLDTVFTYAGSASLYRDTRPVTGRIEPGDLFIAPGYPGHVVVVLDVAEPLPTDGRRGPGSRLHAPAYLLLAQSYMPAQSPHVLVGPSGAGGGGGAARAEAGDAGEAAGSGAWYQVPEPRAPLVTPQWTFDSARPRRLPPDPCR